MRFSVAALLLAPALSLGEVVYTVTPDANAGELSVQMEFPVVGVESRLHMPNWAPGSYRLVDNGAKLKDFHAFDATGKEVPFIQEDVSTWRVPGMNGGKLKVTYRLPSALTDGVMHYAGPATYLYLEGRTQEPSRLLVNLPKDWKIAVGLDKSKHGYPAPNYDVLADNPVSLGAFMEDKYKVAGKEYTIAMRGASKSLVNRAYLTKACKFVSEMESDFFGGSPYSKYVWHFNVYNGQDGAGGLEHLSSTQIQLSSGVGPGAVGVLAHEFFHLWNVKRIRSKVLGPFDYTKLPETGALWWLEGVTDYYAHSLLRRYSWSDDKTFYGNVVRNLRGQRSRQARLEVGPYEASLRVKEAANGRGNSDGYKVSYYNTGFLCGLALDIEILSQTKGQRSLDDVEKALWKECRNNQPGFEEGEIRKLLVKFGGNEVGAMYDTIVMKGGELPIEAQLAKLGLEIATTNETVMSLGFTARRAPNGSIRVRLASDGSPIQEGDSIQSIGKTSFEKPTDDGEKVLLATINGFKSGENVEVKVLRDGKPVTVSVTAKAIERPLQTILEKSDATSAQKLLRTKWLAKRR